MSRKAKRPIALESSVKIEIKDNYVHIHGPKGELSIPLPKGIIVEVKDLKVSVTIERIIIKPEIWGTDDGDGGYRPPYLVQEAVTYEDRTLRPSLGLTWSLINNAVTGVSKGFSRTLYVVGKGWRSTVKDDNINLQVGYSHPVDFKLPKGVTATQKNPGEFTLHSHDKQLLGQVCANIQAIRPVEPYKLKGIRLEGQYLRQKVRKTAGV